LASSPSTGADCNTDLCLMDAEVRDSISVSKQEKQKFDME